MENVLVWNEKRSIGWCGGRDCYWIFSGGIKIMVNRKAKDRKRKKRKLNESLQRQGRTANQIKKKKDKNNDKNKSSLYNQ